MTVAAAGPGLRVAQVSRSAITHNVATLRSLFAPAHLMVVVKANGYGHGALTAARAALAGGADWLGVADIREALALRDAGIAAPILAWLHDPSVSFDAAVSERITLGVSTIEQLDRVEIASRGRRPAVHVKVDTGLGRSGATRADWTSFFGRAAELERSGAIVVEGIFSHLANASVDEDKAQLSVFHDAVARAQDAGLSPRLRHIAASGGAFTVPEARLDMVRAGISAYGLSPSDNVDARDFGLRPAMTLHSRVIAVKRVPAGTGVSYGYTYRTETPTTLALVGLGYADGVPRHVSNRGSVMVAGGVYPIVGRVAMDQCVVAVGDADVRVGDDVVLFGDPSTGAPTADDWARAASTINYEIVTRLGQRILREEVA